MPHCSYVLNTKVTLETMLYPSCDQKLLSTDKNCINLTNFCSTRYKNNVRHSSTICNSSSACRFTRNCYSSSACHSYNSSCACDSSAWLQCLHQLQLLQRLQFFLYVQSLLCKSKIKSEKFAVLCCKIYKCCHRII